MCKFLPAAQRFNLAHDDEHGITLVETLIALAIMGVVAMVFPTVMAQSSKAVMVSQNSVTAESLAKSEMEYVKSTYYLNAHWDYQLPSNPPSWDPERSLPAGYDGYSVQVNADLVPNHDSDDGIQQITVTVRRNGDVVLTLEDYKVKRE